jgi:hypothetical protein
MCMAGRRVRLPFVRKHLLEECESPDWLGAYGRVGSLALLGRARHSWDTALHNFEVHLETK